MWIRRLAVVASCVACALCLKAWWLAYNRRAFAYFMRRFEFYTKGDGMSELLALENDLRSRALDGLADIPRQVMLQFPSGKLSKLLNTVTGVTWHY